MEASEEVTLKPSYTFSPFHVAFGQVFWEGYWGVYGGAGGWLLAGQGSSS